MISKEDFLSALEEVDNAVLAALPEPGDCSFQFSERFKKRMRPVIRRSNHPVIYQTFRRVACIMLALLTLFSSVMIFSTDVRAAVMGWIKEQYDTFYHYFFPEETASVKQVEYTLGWIPDDFTLASTQSTSARSTSIYVGPQNQIIQFTYQTGSASFAAFLDAESFHHKSAKVGSCEADIYISVIQENANGIVWLDIDSNTLFSISARLDETELIKIAEGVTKK